MPAIAATAETFMFHPLKAALQRIKQALLAEIAAECGVKADMEFSEYFDYMVVNCSQMQLGQIVQRLYNAGCTDLHIYTTDEIDLDLFQMFYGNAFRYVKRDTFER